MVADVTNIDDVLRQENSTKPVPGLHTVELRVGENPQALARIREILAEHAEDLSLMVFGRALVRPFIVEQRGFRGETVESLEVSRVSIRALAANLESIARFVRWSKPRKEGGTSKPSRSDCPPALAQLFLETPEGWDRMPHVNRICETPLLRDGRLIAQRGYNAEAASWLHAPSNVQLRTPLNQDTAEACLKRIRTWLAEFPFADRAAAPANGEMSLDESVAICALMTAAMRASLPAAPGFLIDKPSYGAGATTLAKLIHVVLTGRLPPVMSVESDNEEELRKQLDSAQLAGRACVLLDNVRDGEILASTALAQVISEPSRLVRILGLSKDEVVICSQLVLVTGINCTVANDLVRRFLRCRLAATQERPQERTFTRPDLIEEAQAQRADILSDLFTIVAAYSVSRERVEVTPLVGFKIWAQLCAEPLVWLKFPDPIMSSRSLETEDPGTATLRTVIANWRTAFGNASVTARQLIAGLPLHVGADEPAREAALRLREIFTDLCRDGTPNPTRVGTWLNGKKERPIGKFAIYRGENSGHDKVATWVLRSLQ